jgi:hypothetical protein
MRIPISLLSIVLASSTLGGCAARAGVRVGLHHHHASTTAPKKQSSETRVTASGQTSGAASNQATVQSEPEPDK